MNRSARAVSRKGAMFRARRARLWPNARRRRFWWRVLSGMPKFVQVSAALGAALLLLAGVNGLYQVARKPSELFFPVSGALYKTPAETWRDYASIFNRYSTAVITPTFLAAIAQVEGSGNPLARTYWRWRWTSQPFEIYRPASSSVGMYQMTDGTFAEARQFCIRDHVLVGRGSWNDWHSCWFNVLYARVLPADAAELTSAYLDWHVSQILQRHRANRETLRQQQDLAALIHLCGAGAAEQFARRGFRLLEGEKCGDHDARGYLAHIAAARREFDRLAANGV